MIKRKTKDSQNGTVMEEEVALPATFVQPQVIVSAESNENLIWGRYWIVPGTKHYVLSSQKMK